MATYSHILLAADFNPDFNEVVARAKQLRDAFQCKLSLIHVIEPVTLAYGGEMPIDLSVLHDELRNQAQTQLNQLATELGVDANSVFLEFGVVEREMMRVVKEQNVDLIVVGSHGKRGWALLLGSTANAVLHQAPCDVLAVRVHKPK
ncbi:MAG TPA: universal stress protein [Pseudomonadales bacterium]|nr:universal stress protein [Pseudomonadales bacterium]